MLMAMCRNPACRNPAVTIRHTWPSATSGPYKPGVVDHLAATLERGGAAPASSTRKAATLMAISA